MKKVKTMLNTGLKTFPVGLISFAIQSHVLAQSENNQIEVPISVNVNITSPIEEVRVLGRIQSSAQDLVFERMESETVVDIIGAEQITRIGDSSIALALKRVPGITLVNGKFIYIRGLGERYSSTLLNGATVPSPDLTRNVLPLDIFPASIVKSIAIQKGYTPDMPATFGGGNIDIRTKGIPDGPVIGFEIKTGINTISDTRLRYSGGGDDNLGTDDGTRALHHAIDDALRFYRTSTTSSEGNLSPGAILATANRTGNPITAAEAAARNAELATRTYRNLDIQEEDQPLNDYGASMSLGNVFDIGDMWQVGGLFDLQYDKSTRTDERISRAVEDPKEEFDEETKTTDNVSITGALNLGVKWGDDHSIESKNLFIRNTDDEVAIKNIYGQGTNFSSGQGSRHYDYQYEERELTINQVTGSHHLGYDTRDALGLGDKLSFLDELQFDWFYSDATATTDIPSQTRVQATITRDTATNQIIASQIRRNNRMMDIRYTNLEDQVDSSGFNISLPISLDDFEIQLRGGGKYDRKVRTYYQLDLSLGTTSSAVNSTLGGDISEVFSDENITNPDFEYTLFYQDGLSRSYIAATTTDAFFSSVDVLWNETWRLALGARYEEYKQFGAPWQPYRIRGSQIRTDFSGVNEGRTPDGIFYQDDIYGAASLTYITQNFWAEDFQLRLAVSETTVRPDLRETAPSSFQDPLDDSLQLEGNPNVIPSDLMNIDLRGEWYFSTRDSLTISLFYKDITNPIEYFTNPGAENSETASIKNAASGKTQGIEFEWLKNLGFMGDFASQFYVSGNVTLAESEIQVGDKITTAVTNRVRPLHGASEYVANIQFGYDSDDGSHAATLVYNVSGERIFKAGISGEADEYEQPFDAIDFSYAYYLNDSFTVKFKARNLLDNNVLITQGDVDIFEKKIGQSFSLSLKYSYY